MVLFTCSTSSLPNFVGTFVPVQTILAEPIAQHLPTEMVVEHKSDLSPPLYQDATKLLRVKQVSQADLGTVN